MLLHTCVYQVREERLDGRHRLLVQRDQDLPHKQRVKVSQMKETEISLSASLGSLVCLAAALGPLAYKIAEREKRERKS